MFRVLVDGCKPTRGSKYSACVDVYASEDVFLGAGATMLVGLGIAIDDIDGFVKNEMKQRYGLCGLDLEEKAYCDAFKKSHYIQLMLRSSLGKKGLILPNGVGVIDLDYKDEIKMIIHNPMQFKKLDNKHLELGVDFEIKKGDRIGQITLLEHHGYLFGIETEEERDGGFGSTGDK